MATVRPDMLISEILAVYPGAADVFASHGLGCASCLAAGMESLAVVATAHDVSLNALMEDLNRLDAAPEPKET